MKSIRRILSITAVLVAVGAGPLFAAQPNSVDVHVNGIGSISAPLQVVLLRGGGNVLGWEEETRVHSMIAPCVGCVMIAG